ncbi:MAG: hypothetical protein MZV64_63380 [Ignavibacteriales bacterium]|nr:hypothetical protein [Ignavibacteriales bacterium]
MPRLLKEGEGESSPRAFYPYSHVADLGRVPRFRYNRGSIRRGGRRCPISAGPPSRFPRIPTTRSPSWACRSTRNRAISGAPPAGRPLSGPSRPASATAAIPSSGSTSRRTPSWSTSATSTRPATWTRPSP